MIALIALAALVSPSSHGDAERGFGSWGSVCDNALRCQASSSMGDPANMQVRMFVHRDAGGDAAPRIGFSSAGGSQQGPRSVVIDGHGYGLVDRGTDWGVQPGQDLAVARALAKARSVYVVAGAERFPINAKGTAAALRDMDARQGRTGTVTAIVATGAKPASSVPAPPPLPVRLESKRPRRGLVIRPSQQLLAAWRRAAHCDGKLNPADHPPESWGIDARTGVILVGCWVGGHNDHYLVKVGRHADGTDARDAEFDFFASIGEHSGPTEPPNNPERDEDSGRLISGQRGGIAYPSTSEEWVWDGQRFRIVEGWTSYGSTFRARVRQR
jgi:hypothetical protein